MSPTSDSTLEPAAAPEHVTVMLHEAVDALRLAPDAVVVDATFGRGGHSRLMLKQLGPSGRVLALDRDPMAVEAALHGPNAINDARFSIHHTAFARAPELLAQLGIERIDGWLMDLGVSSPQIDQAERGFSFRFDGPLDMRMDTTQGQSAESFLLEADEQEIAHVVRTYGEERFAGPIAKALVARRESGHPVRSTAELSEVVAGAVKTREAGQNPATRTFQALRIHVNQELAELETALATSLNLLAPGGRLAVISFHSLEDRLVKTFMNDHSREVFDRRAPFAAPAPCRLSEVQRWKPSETEVRANPRSRSAVLRAATRTEVA